MNGSVFMFSLGESDSEEEFVSVPFVAPGATSEVEKVESDNDLIIERWKELLTAAAEDSAALCNVTTANFFVDSLREKKQQQQLSSTQRIILFHQVRRFLHFPVSLSLTGS